VICDYAFGDCTNLAELIIGNGVTRIENGAFARCAALTKVIYCGTQEQWDAIVIEDHNESLTGATLQLHDYENGVCTICRHCSYITGDIDGNGVINQDDAVYLLLHTMFGENRFPLNSAPGDVDRNDKVNQDDAVYLLLHTMFGENRFPLNPPAPAPEEEDKTKPGHTGTPIA
jgi:hypothetical protein